MGFFRCLVYLSALSLGCFLLGLALPRWLFSPVSFPFCSFAFEGETFYKKLHIRRWKDKFPDMSRACRFLFPKRIRPGMKAETLYRLARETCVAEAVHGLEALFGFVCLWLWQGGGFVCALLYAFANLPYILIQRYNRPKLLAYAARLSLRGK